MTGLRPFIEVETHKALVSVNLLDQHRVLKEMAAVRSNKFARGKDEATT